MTFALYERFAETIKKEAESLLESEEGGINPRGVKKDVDGFEYVYSLAALDKVIGYFTSFEDCLSRREKEEKNRSLFNLDKETFRSLPCKIAFGLRGYIGAVSEDSMLLQGKNEVELQVLLNKWSKVNMRDGQEQDDLYQFLWNYENQWVNQVWKSKPSMFDDIKSSYGIVDERLKEGIDNFIKSRVEKKLKDFKEVMMVSLEIAEAMFLSVWRDYNEMLVVQKEEKVSQQEYIDKIVDEKLGLVREDLENLMQVCVSTRKDIDVLFIKEQFEGIRQGIKTNFDLIKGIQDFQNQQLAQQTMIPQVLRNCAKCGVQEHQPFQKRCMQCGNYF